MRHLAILITLAAFTLLPLSACGDSSAPSDTPEADSTVDSDATANERPDDTGDVTQGPDVSEPLTDTSSAPEVEVEDEDVTTPTADDAEVQDDDPEDVNQGSDIQAPAPDVDPDEVQEPNADWDNDGLTNLQEAFIGSDPNNPDSDGDGLNDSEEFTQGTSVFLSDSDGDGLNDADEVADGINPTRSDSDGDGVNDADEKSAESDPNDRWSWPFGTEVWPDMSAFSETTYGSGWGAGDFVPEIAMIDQFGEAIEMARFHGYVVLLDFAAGWCLPCREAAEEAEAKWASLREQGFMIIHLLVEGNQPGTPATAGLQNEWRIQYGISFPVVREPEGGTTYTNFTEKSGIYPGLLPFYVLLDRDMRIDSGYGPGSDSAMQARIAELLEQDVPALAPAPSHATDLEAALICDADQDGVRHSSCGGPDCDDADEAIHPDAEELCDAVDHNCDGHVHEGASDATLCYADTDGDSFGSPEITKLSCGVPWPYVANNEDCNDGDAAINPLTSWYEDKDNDGLGNPDVSVTACEPPDGFVGNDGDSDDGDGSSLGCWSHITVGRDHSCGLKSDGTITCWGCNTNNQHNAPEGSFVAIDSGMTHTCAMDAQGAISCWGSNTSGSLNVPDEVFTSFSCGLNFCCGITTAETNNIRCWGDNSSQQSTPPEGTFVQVAAGDSRHACAVDGAGEMVCWGFDYGLSGAENPLLVPDEAEGEVRIGHKYTMALASDGSAIGWGKDGSGQSSPPADTFRDVRGGIVHSCGLREDGSLTCWGSNSLDRCEFPPGDNYTQIDVGQFHSCALGDDGLATCWGSGTCHEDFCPGNYECGKMVVPSCND